MRRALLLMAVLLVAATAATAQGDNKYNRETLRGLKGVYVLVLGLTPEAEAGGLNKLAIQTDVELKLRQAGIKVLTKTEALAAPGAPYLYITVDVLASDGTPTTVLYALSLSVILGQTVRLERDPSIRAPATTWSANSFGMAGSESLAKARDSIKDKVDQFINAWLSVNPK